MLTGGFAAVLQQAGSEGELCQAESLGSAGSSSTLASSVIEVEAERAEPGLTPQLQSNKEHEEETEEELTPLSPPPTLSITEEILEFISQSRAREGLTSTHSDATDQLVDPPSSNQANFTCPLPPVACPSSSEQTAAVQQEQERVESEDQSMFHSQSGSPGEESETTSNEIPDAVSQVENELEADVQTHGEGVEKEKDEKKTGDEKEGESVISAPATADLQPSITAEAEEVNCIRCHLAGEEMNTEVTSSPTSDALDHPTQKRKPPTRGSHLTKRDKKIIEKIRSYYEAAAEAEEDDAEEPDDQVEGVASRRRNSFSQIPSGLVKESVSRFDVGGHYEETESGQSKYETTEAIDRETDQDKELDSSRAPNCLQTQTSLDAEKNKEGHKPISSLDLDAQGSVKLPPSAIIQDKETPNQQSLNLESNQNVFVGEESETWGKCGKVCKGPLEEDQEIKQEGTTSVAETGEQVVNSLQEEGPCITREDATKTTKENQPVMNGQDLNQAEQNGSHKEPSTTLLSTEQCQETEAKTQSAWTRTKNRDRFETSKNLGGLPSQIQVGRWSRHSRIVTANRTLFEGMASDVASIRLFEASPVVDPVLIENSERILSKVQTLARMYSAKASSMKVPLHQKLASTVRTQSSSSSGLSGNSNQTETKSQTQVQTQTTTMYQQQARYQMENSQSYTHTETKSETQTHCEIKVQSPTTTESRQQLQGEGEIQMCSKTHHQSQDETQTTRNDDQRDEEKRMIKTAESLTNDFQETAVAPSEPQLFGHLFVTEQLTPACPQMNGFTLSRPRDFLSAVTKQKQSRSRDNAQTSNVAGDQSSSEAQADCSNAVNTLTQSSLASTASGPQHNAQAEDHSSTFFCSATNSPSMPTMTLDCGVTELGKFCLPSSSERDKRLDWNREVYTETEEAEEIDGSEQTARHPVYLSGEESTCHNISSQPTHSEPHCSAHSIPQWIFSKDGDEKDHDKWNKPAAQCTHDSLTKSVKSVYAGQGSAPSPCSPLLKSESDPIQSRPSSVQPRDGVPTCSSQRSPDLPGAMGKWALSNTRSVSDTTPHEKRDPDQHGAGLSNSLPIGFCPSSSPEERPNPAITTSGQDQHLSFAPSAFRPGFRNHSPSPIRAPHTSSPLPPSPSSVRVPPCYSPSRIAPASSSGTLSPETVPDALSSLSSSRVSSMRANPPSSPTPSSPLLSSPIASSSAFTRSLAASCISQSISQSMAKNSARQQPATINKGNQSPSSAPSLPTSHLRRHSPSPKFAASQQASTTPAFAQLGWTKDGSQYPRCPPSSPQSSCPSLAHHQPAHSSSSTPHPSFPQPKTDASQNANSNNNNNISVAGLSTPISNMSNSSSCGDGDWLVSQKKIPIANGSTNATFMQQTHDPLWQGSYNRVARPFSASEPSSRVQSPSPSPSPATFARLCSPPPQHNYSSPMANKPPNPRSTRVGGVNTHNPLGLTLELPRASSSSCMSPRILSPPPIGVSVNAWTNNVAAPQPRNPSSLFSPSLGPPTCEKDSYPISSSVPLQSSTASSPFGSCPSSQITPQNLHRSTNTSLADRSPNSARSNSGGQRRSWQENSYRSLSFNASAQGSFDQHESCPTSPRNGWSSSSSSPSCLSPQAGLQSPLSPGLTPGKGPLGGQHFTSVPWPDVQELSNIYSRIESFDISATSTVIAPSPSPVSSSSRSFFSSPSQSQAEWGDPEPEEGNCRSQLICAYVARPSCEQNLSSSCLVLSSSGMTTPPPATFQHQTYQSQVKAQPQFEITAKTSPVPLVHSPLPSSSSPLPFAHSSPTKPGNQKTSYATTVNLQIAGSGRITSFSTAQVSLTQTLQGGAGAGSPGQGQAVRRVSINGLSHIPSPLPQNCNRL
ncbi:mucin-2-like isoform X2 [Channa argus]|uniref:mucin-2-like isoform X2 n=1 Tax=Channa argus TaxID=215402 RepID=UPI003521D81F